MSGYIMELRKLVGHRTLIQCAASIIVINQQGKILLGKEQITIYGVILADHWKLMKKWKTAQKENCRKKWG